VKRPTALLANFKRARIFENENPISDEFSKERSRLSHFKIPLPLPLYLAHLPWVLADTTLQLQLTLPVAKGTQVLDLGFIGLRFHQGSGLSSSKSLLENPFGRRRGLQHRYCDSHKNNFFSSTAYGARR
jgi:hypothetical protein